MTLVFALSAPVQLPNTGVTEYRHVPAGTLFSVQVKALIVPEQFAPMV